MAEVYHNNIIDIDLESGTLFRSFLNHTIGSGDNNANWYGVRVFRKGEPIALSGCSVQGLFMPASGAAILISDGTHTWVSGNEAAVLLPQACYNVKGQFTLTIKIIGTNSYSITDTVRIIDGVVADTYSENPVAPTAAVPTYQEILAVYDQMVAAKDGSVRFDIDQTLTAAQMTQARGNIAAASESDVSDLNLALDDAIKIDPVIIHASENVAFLGNGTYYPYPMTFLTSTISIKFRDSNNNILFLYDENENLIPASYQHPTLGGLELPKRCTITVDGTDVYLKLYLNKDEYDAGYARNNYHWHFTEIPTVIYTNAPITFNRMYTEEVAPDHITTLNPQNEEMYEQIESYVLDSDRTEEYADQKANSFLKTENFASAVTSLIPVNRFNEVFNTIPVIIPENTKQEFPGDGAYFPYPLLFTATADNVFFYNASDEVLFLYDENNNKLPQKYQHPTIGSFSFSRRNKLVIDGTDVYYCIYINKTEYDSGISRDDYHWHFLEKPAYIRTTNIPISFQIPYFETIDQANQILTKINTETSIGLLDQIGEFVYSKQFASLDNQDEFARRLTTKVIRDANKMNHLFRIATFNIARYGQGHWYKIKECLQNYGIDICALQEVSYPQGGGGSTMNNTLKGFFTSWQFSSFSDNGNVGEFPNNGNYPNNVRNLMTGNGFAIDSTVETYLSVQAQSGDYRYVAKSVVSLPKYMDKRGSDKLKLSIYNTQLEVVSATVAEAQAREILSMAQSDENPFVIIVGDTNDFTLEKNVWKIFKNGGFAPIINTNSSTTAGVEDFNCIDNIFLSSRVKAKSYNIVCAQEYPFIHRTTRVQYGALSDHDLVFADIEFDYSDIRCVNLVLDHCTTTWTKGWLNNQETISFAIVADNGYVLPNAPNKMLDCMMANSEALSYSNGIVTIDGTKLVGDVFIKMVATAVN